MKVIYLVGFMGSGKTTVGRELSKTLQKSFVDLDEEIEKNQQKKIADIFQEEGEAKFRQYETTALMSATDFSIVSTGGGIVESRENIDYMRASGTIVYLQASFDLIRSRLQNDTARPLWKENLEKKALYHKRIKLYKACADMTVDSNQPLQEKVRLLIQNVEV